MNKNFMIETNRLIIRRFWPSDAGDLYDYLSREEVVRFEPYPVHNKMQCEKEAERRAGDESFLAVCHKKLNKVIGNIYFARMQPEAIKTWELGYVFNSDFWGEGYALEACAGILDYAFGTLDAHRIVAMCNPKNVSSWKLLERLRFRREGHLVKNMYFTKSMEGRPLWNDTYIYAMLGVEYLLRKYHEID